MTCKSMRKKKQYCLSHLISCPNSPTFGHTNMESCNSFPRKSSSKFVRAAVVTEHLPPAMSLSQRNAALSRLITIGVRKADFGSVTEEESQWSWTQEKPRRSGQFSKITSLKLDIKWNTRLCFIY